MPLLDFMNELIHILMLYPIFLILTTERPVLINEFLTA